MEWDGVESNKIGENGAEIGELETTPEIETTYGGELASETFSSYEELETQVESNTADGSDVHDYSQYSAEIDEDMDFADVPGEAEPEQMSVEELLTTDEELAQHQNQDWVYVPPDASADALPETGSGLVPETFPSYEALEAQVESSTADGSDVHDYSQYSAEIDEDMDFADVPGEAEPEQMSVEELLMTDEELAQHQNQDWTYVPPDASANALPEQTGSELVPETFSSYEELEAQVESSTADGSDVHDYSQYSAEIDEDMDFADVPGEAEPEQMSVEELLMTDEELAQHQDYQQDWSDMPPEASTDTHPEQGSELKTDGISTGGFPQEVGMADGNGFLHTSTAGADSAFEQRIADLNEGYGNALNMNSEIYEELVSSETLANEQKRQALEQLKADTQNLQAEYNAQIDEAQNSGANDIGLDSLNDLNRYPKSEWQDSLVHSDVKGHPEVDAGDKLQGLCRSGYDLGDLAIERQNEVAEAFEGIAENHPEIRDFIGDLRLEEIEGNSQAHACPNLEFGTLDSSLVLNSRFFNDPEFEKVLAQEKAEGYAAGEGIKGVVMHELAHIMQLRMDSKLNGLDFGTSLGDKLDNLDAMSQAWENNSNTGIICRNALSNLGLTEEDIGSNLSEYANKDYGECFAEAISEYYSCTEPRPLAREIVKEYFQFIRERGLD